MKKVFLSLATVAMAISSCTNQEVLDVREGAAIGFNTFVGKSTRAYNETDGLTSFYVYGGYAEVTNLFEAQEVTGSAGNYTYAPLRYWVKDAEYKFGAISENTPNTTFNYATGNLTVANYTVADNGDVDLVVAQSVPTITGKESGNTAVSFTFSHVLSKVNLQFISEWDASAKVEITDIKLSGIANTNTSLTASSSALTWGTASGSADYDFEEVTIENTNNEEQAKGTQETKYLMPQTLGDAAKLTFKVTVTINGNSEEKTIDVLLNTGTSNASKVEEWEKNMVYNYSLTLNAGNVFDLEPITFDASVEPWDTNETDVDLTPENEGTYNEAE